MVPLYTYVVALYLDQAARALAGTRFVLLLAPSCQEAQLAGLSNTLCAYAQDTLAHLVAARLAQERGLNPRESEVLGLLLAGRTNAQVASELFISESTVKKHVNALYHKLGVSSRLSLTALVAGLAR